MNRSSGGALVLILILAPYAHAQAPTLERAETELAAGHAAQAQSIAQSLVDEGRHVGAELAPIYRVLGLAAATAGNEDVAREAFTRWLALDPEGHLDRSLPDDVRSPFLEARGFWAQNPVRLAAEPTLREDGAGITVAVTDPASMVARVRARIRIAGGNWTDVVRAPSASLSIDVAGLASAHRADVVLTFLDESGNRIWQRGSDDQPIALGAAAEPHEVVTGPDQPPPPVVATADATGFHVGAVITGIVAVGAIVGAAIAHADRERLAGIYNGDGTGCTGTGSTRGEICGPQRNAISNDEVLAGVLYGIGGAAAVTAILLVGLAPSGTSDSHTAISCGAGPGQIGIACGGSF